MNDLYIHYQNSQQYFDLPSDWNLLTFAVFPERSLPDDVEALAHEVLKAPTGHAPLDQCLSLSNMVAILIEDPSRASPKQKVLRALLAELDVIGVPKEQIVIVIALL